MNRSRLCALGIAALLTSGGAATAAEVSYDLGFYSHYVWRGITVTDDPVFQPGITISHDSGFSFNVWGNLDLTDVNGADGELIELDLTASYAFDAGEVASVELGVIQYTFAGFGPSTRELYLTLGFDVPLSPYVTVYYDFDEVDDYYANVGIEYGADLSDSWSWTLAVWAGYTGEDWSRFYVGTGESGFFDGNASFSLDLAIDDHFAFGLMAAYSDSLDDKTLPDQPTELWGGAYIGLSF